MDGRVWYVVVTAPRAEETAARALADLGHEVYLPHATRWARLRRRKAKARERIRRPAFPRYLFLGVDGCPNWMAIRAADGVTGVLCREHSPIRLAGSDVDDVRCAEDMGAFDETTEPRRLTVGDEVMLTFGPFEGYVAVVTRPQRGDRQVDVAIEMFGRRVTAAVPLDKFRILA